MAQEFASDSSIKNGFLSRLNLSNHRGFFSVIFVSLSLVLLLVTFAAVRQQQTTQTKAATSINICENVNCNVTPIHPDYGEYCEGRISVTNPFHNPVREACCQNINRNCQQRDRDCIGLNSNQCQTFSNYCTLSNGSCANINTIPENPHECNEVKGDVGDKCAYSTESNGSCTTYNCKDGLTCKFISLSRGSECSGGGEETGCTASTCALQTGPNADVRCAAHDCCYWSESESKCKYGSLPGSGTKIYNPRTTCGSGGLCLQSNNGSALQAGGACSFNDKTGTFQAGLCPGGSDVVCCVPPGGGPVDSGGNSSGYNDTACTNVNGVCQTGATAGASCNNGTGKYQTGKCGGPSTRLCCVPNSGGGTTPQACTKLLTLNTCEEREDCEWLSNTEKCRYTCPGITPLTDAQTKCTARNDCVWKDNKCINKTEPSVNKDVDLNLKLAFQGVVSKPKTTSKVNVRVKLVDAANKEVVKDGSPFTVDDNGIWSGKVSFKNVDINQKYYILIKGPLHLQKKICQANASETKEESGYYSCIFGNIKLKKGTNDFDFSKVLLLAGDIDRNGVVDSVDTGIIRNVIEKNTVDQKLSADVLKIADLNYDGFVNSQDWSAVMAALGIKNDEK